MKNSAESQKNSYGALATMTFIFTTLYMAATSQGASSIFSLKGIAFAVGGMFLSALLVGAPFYFIQTRFAKVLAHAVPVLGKPIVGLIAILFSLAFFAGPIALAFYLTSKAYMAVF